MSNSKSNILFLMILAGFILPHLCLFAAAEEQNYYIFFSSCRDYEKNSYKMTLPPGGFWSITTNSYPYVDFYCASEIYRMNSDGSNQTRITNNEYEEALLSAVPGREKLVFTYYEFDWEIGWMDYNGGNLESLTEDNENEDYAQKVDSKGSKLIYTSASKYPKSDDEKDSEIKMLDLKTLEKKQLTYNSIEEECARAISSDSKFLFYQSYINDSRKFKRIASLLNIETGEEATIFETQQRLRDAMFSSDDKFLAVTIEDKKVKNKVNFAVISVEDRKIARVYSGADEDVCDKFHFFNDSQGVVALCRNSEEGGYFVIYDFLNNYDWWIIEPPEIMDIVEFDLTPDESYIVFSSAILTGMKTMHGRDLYKYIVSKMDIDGNKYELIKDTPDDGSDIVVAPIYGDGDEDVSDEDE